MTTRVDVKSELLVWARERAGLRLDELIGRFPKLGAWESADARPTLKQLEAFAKATHVPIGYLFLARPPVETIPIPDFRTVGSRRAGPPSPNLLETVYLCQQRQAWYRDFVRSTGGDRLPFVGSATLDSDVVETAADMRRRLGFDLEARRSVPTWTDALRGFIQQAENLSVLVMCSGVVLNNNRRKLDPDEFRGFALSDPLAPVVFINGADTKAAQMFTLAHELAHVWLGQSALSDSQASTIPSQRTERWCNHVAAELLVPLESLLIDLKRSDIAAPGVQQLARRYKVSSLVILRRLHDAGRLSRTQFQEAYDHELSRVTGLPTSDGGNFYLTQPVRASKRFVRALIISTLEGQTLYRDALRLLGISKADTLHELGRSVDVI